jgi:hypothetical protein
VPDREPAKIIAREKLISLDDANRTRRKDERPQVERNLW